MCNTFLLVLLNLKIKMCTEPMQLYVDVFVCIYSVVCICMIQYSTQFGTFKIKE